MSDSLVINMDDVEDNNFDVLPNGWYVAVISNYAEDIQGNEIMIKKSDGKLPQGTKGTSWEFVPITSPSGEDLDGKGKVWTTYWHHAQVASFWKQLYKAAGLSVEGNIDILDMRDDALGEEVWVQIGQQTYNGTTRNTIKGIKHLSERAIPKSNEDDGLDDFEDDE